MGACSQQACGIPFSGSKLSPVAEDSALQVRISASVVLSDSTLGHQIYLDIHKVSFIMQKAYEVVDVQLGMSGTMIQSVVPAFYVIIGACSLKEYTSLCNGPDQ